ncbi:MAG: thioredoxin family protein [Candidatus Margulisiibacteriota bacterium]
MQTKLKKFIGIFVLLCSLIQPSTAITNATKVLTTTKHVKSTQNITKLSEALKAGVPVVVKIGSESCGPCRAMNPIMKELVVEQDGKAIFLSLDVYENRELASRYSVRVIPTILFYNKKGVFKSKAEGFMDKEQLLKAVKTLELNK